MHQLATLCEAVSATTKKNEKTLLVAEYLRGREVGLAATSAVFLSGRAFPAYDERTLQVGGVQLERLVTELGGRGAEGRLNTAYRKHGDLGSAAFDVLLPTAPATSTLSVEDVEAFFLQISAARGTAPRLQLMRELLGRATALEAKYIIKIMTGDLRIGLKQSLVEEAVARAFEVQAAQVQRANMLLGDIGGTVRLAAAHRLDAARMRMFHPIGLMLASPAEDAEEAFSYFEHARVEDKYDGIRAQAHISGGKVRIFSRTLDDITESFPELVPPLTGFTKDTILDGEILAWSFEGETGRALPFSQLQKRLGRKRVAESMMQSVPVAYVVFDVLYAGEELVIDKPLTQRAEVLDRLFAEVKSPAQVQTVAPQGVLMFEPAVESAVEHVPRVLRAPWARADSAKALERLFNEAQARGNEGLMIKDVTSTYAPGRRGRSWLKLKRELATLDVVVTAVEFGHGRRAPVLSDYTFAVRADDRLVNVGKAYTGLTDDEIALMTEWFLAHTTIDQGYRREVEPKVVIEVAFNAVMRSDRHDSGFALRFPRILRLRPDKSPEEIDTIERVEEIYGKQHARAA